MTRLVRPKSISEEAISPEDHMETFTGNETTIIRPLAEAESQVTSRCNRDLAPPNKRR
jgi:hypothetical protein